MLKYILLQFLSISAFSQLQLTLFPADYQLYIREDNNVAYVKAIGQYHLEINEKIELEFYKNDSLKSVLESKNESFDFSIEILPELSEYSFKLYVNKNGAKTLLKTADKVLCGDAIFLYGQSNMVAPAGVDSLKNTVSDKFMRNFDFPLGNPVEAKFLQWMPGHLPFASVGTIGISLMQTMIDSFKMPFAVINGSYGGAQAVYLLQRNPDNHSDTKYPYGRVLARLKNCGSFDKIRYMAYFQGEGEASNWNPDCLTYPAYFRQLFSNLFEDIPSLTKFYEFQISVMKNREVGTVQGAGFLRDFQRNTATEFPDIVRTIAAVGTLPYDGVHYGAAAYLGFGKTLAKMVLRDFYGRIGNAELDSPNLKYAFYNTQKDSITLVFQEEQKVKYPEEIQYNGYSRPMKLFFYLNSKNSVSDYTESTLPVESGSSKGNRILLKLNQNRTEKYITYLPSSFSDSFSTIYDGPHITNSKNLRAFTFYNVPILDAEPKEIDKPNMPLKLVANGVSDNTVNITWQDDSAIETKFDLEISDDNSTFKLLKSFTSNSNFYIDQDKIANKSYYYRLKACNSLVCSNYTSTAKATTYKNPQSNNPFYYLPLANYLESKSLISVFPNPLTNSINFSIPAEENIRFSKIYNLQGLSVFEGNPYLFNFSNLPTGQYFIKIVTDKSEYSTRFVKL